MDWPLLKILAVFLGLCAAGLIVWIAALRADSRGKSLRQSTQVYPRHGAYDVDGWGGN